MKKLALVIAIAAVAAAGCDSGNDKSEARVPAPYSAADVSYGADSTDAGTVAQAGDASGALNAEGAKAFLKDAQERLATMAEEVSHASWLASTYINVDSQFTEALAVEQRPASSRPRNATPAIRALARRLGVDLENLHPAGARFTEAEVRAAARGETIPRWTEKAAISNEVATKSRKAEEKLGAETSPSGVSPARRAMAIAMSRARDQVCPMTLFDEVDISDWPKGSSTTLRLLKAIARAAAEEPNLNAHFDNEALEPKTPVNVGLAVDAPRGLFVPVLQDVGAQSEEDLLDRIARFKQQASEGAIPQKDLQGATIHLSNFGSLAGRFATPVVVPPLVCIVGAGRAHKAVLPHKGKARVRKLLPLSITADHRAVTGGELARFLKALKEHLQ